MKSKHTSENIERLVWYTGVVAWLPSQQENKKKKNVGREFNCFSSVEAVEHLSNWIKNASADPAEI